MQLALHKNYLQHMRRSAALSEASRSAANALLERCRESGDPDYIDWPALQDLFKSINASEPAGWTSRLAQSLGTAAHGALGFAAVSASNLQESLGLFVEYVGTRTALFEIVMRQTEDSVEIEFAPRVERSAELSLVEELFLGSALLLTETMIDADFSALVISLATPATEPLQLDSFVGDSLLGFDLNVQRGQRTALLIPKPWLTLPSLYADEQAFHSNRQRCYDQSQRLVDVALPLRQQIEDRLQGFFDRQRTDYLERGHIAAAPTLEQLAAALNMSSRTLVRRLKAEHTAYKSILAARRQQLAIELLAEQRYSVEDVAHMLAYSDAGNFIRAFQHWYQQTPGAWRQQRFADGDASR